ncbi:MAG TPA: 2-oxoglutarate dehydrogenase complex dihydrolipoyllysine-residue succinyltransferase [Candidatus Acidoferrales bacterium]|nr:2-oxoglutarate dehydrogenase complex dihydrolipoyllysine-residue succinyltransferase [Candidatus Acidoferrales bacterium]
MSIEIKVPEVGESISEVLIGNWLKSEGDHVERDEEVVVIETDKATLEVPAPDAGTITKVLKQNGDKAAVGDVIAYLEEGTEAPIQEDGAKKVKPETRVVPSKERREKAAEQKGIADKPVREKEQDDEAKRPAYSDTVKSKPWEAEIEEPMIAAGKGKAESTLHKATGEAGYGAEAETGRSSQLDKEERVEKVVPMTLIRRRIAERLVQAQQTTASVTTFNEIDMSTVKSLRDEHQEAFQEKYQIKLGFMSFFVKATVEALKLVPQINAEMRGADLVFRNYCDIGIAVGGGKGLVVPVLRGADRMSFAAIEQSIADFARRAESHRLKPQDLEGGTFTISNGGVYGSLLSTPILNFPQSGILGLHAIQERPVVRNGEVAVRPMMYVALTYDHRVIDGREAVTFLKRIKECIETPARMLLEI